LNVGITTTIFIRVVSSETVKRTPIILSFHY
jgi:hypothetical protein